MIQIINQKEGSKFLKTKGLFLLAFINISLGLTGLIFVAEVFRNQELGTITYLALIPNIVFMIFYSTIALDFIKQSKNIKQYPSQLEVESLQICDNGMAEVLGESWNVKYERVNDITLDCYAGKIILPSNYAKVNIVSTS